MEGMPMMQMPQPPMEQMPPMGQKLPWQMEPHEAWNKACVSQGKKFFSRLGLMYFFGTLVIYGVQLAVTLALYYIEPGILEDANFSLMASMLPMYLVGMPIMIVLIRTMPARQLPQRSMSAGKWVLAMIMSYSIMYCSNMIGILITFLISLLKGTSVVNDLQEITTSVHPMISAVFMVVCAPLYEEFIFRKLLVDRAVLYGESVAVILSGMAFGLFHGNLSQFAYASTLGMFFAFIYVRTGRLRYTILMHMVINFMGGVIAPVLLNLLNTDTLNEVLLDQGSEAAAQAMMQALPGLLLMLGYMFCLFGIVIAGFVLLIVFRKKFRAEPKGIMLPEGRRFTTVVFNVGMTLFCIFWIVMIIWQLFR